MNIDDVHGENDVYDRSQIELEPGLPEQDENPGVSGQLIASDRNHFRFSRSLTPLSEPNGVRSASLGALRNHIAEQHLRGGKRSLAVTGPGEGVGCTLLATNLAIAAAQSGISTLLVDANLRGSGIEEFIVPGEDVPGLSDYLSGRVQDPGKIIQSEVLPNLSVIYSGKESRNPQVLLSGDSFKELMDECVRNYALTIVDTPPANSSSDVRRIASVLRYALIVVRRDVSFVADVRTLIEELQSDKVRVVGTFLNVD